MSGRGLVRLLGGYALLLIVLCFIVHRVYSLHAAAHVVLATVWRGGEPVARESVGAVGDRNEEIDRALEAPGARVVYETVVEESPLLTFSETVFGISLVPGRDGVSATFGGDAGTFYVTPDELLARQGYDKGRGFPELGLPLGAEIPLVYALLAERMHASVPKIRDEAKLRRIRVERSVPGADEGPRVTGDSLSAEDVRAAVIAAASYLARGQSGDGKLRYLVDAPTDHTINDYDWPRHAGATYFLTQAAALSKDEKLAEAARRAAALIRTKALQRCRDATCVGTEDVVEIGSTSLSLIAFVELVRTGVEPAYLPLIPKLARFLREQQRPDGEFMHEFDRRTGAPHDVQYLYFSGEATLALARAGNLMKDEEDLGAASKGLAHLTGPAWSFFGNRYYFGEEHWTCQAVSELWEKAPDRASLDFCLRWQAYGREMQYADGDTPFDADGAYGVGPVVTPRLTPVASRCEAGVATLDAARRSHDVTDGELAALNRQLRRSLALLVRHQLKPGPLTHLFANPEDVYGGIPGSPVDWQLRIDYAQHAGSAMIRWLEVVGSTAR